MLTEKLSHLIKYDVPTKVTVLKILRCGKCSQCNAKREKKGFGLHVM